MKLYHIKLAEVPGVARGKVRILKKKKKLLRIKTSNFEKKRMLPPWHPSGFPQNNSTVWPAVANI